LSENKEPAHGRNCMCLFHRLQRQKEEAAKKAEKKRK
jgi:hypothetical protein